MRTHSKHRFEPGLIRRHSNSQLDVFDFLVYRFLITRMEQLQYLSSLFVTVLQLEPARGQKSDI